MTATVQENILFFEMEEEAKEDCIDAFEGVTVDANQPIIKQGSQGDFFYVIETGECEVFVRPKDGVGSELPMKTKVGALSDGECFGELALMYNSPRAATIISGTKVHQHLYIFAL